MTNIGIMLKNMRISAGMSQKEIGDMLSLADTTISSYERGNSQPDFETIIKFAKICGYTIQFVNKEKKIDSTEYLSREF